jgi:hypothetical protein
MEFQFLQDPVDPMVCVAFLMVDGRIVRSKATKRLDHTRQIPDDLQNVGSRSSDLHTRMPDT